MGRISSVMMAVLLTALFGQSAYADQGRGRGHGKGAVAKNERVVFDRDGDRRIVREYFQTNGLPPGLAKRNSLPPGLQKQLRQRGELPPGLQKRLTPVPVGLQRRLPGLPPYYSRYFAGDDLIVIDRRSNRVASIIDGIY